MVKKNKIESQTRPISKFREEVPFFESSIEKKIKCEKGKNATRETIFY